MKKIYLLFLFLILLLNNSYSQSSWFRQYNGTVPLYSIVFVDLNTGYACGQSGLILKTTNGGFNWSNQVSNTANDLSAIYFLNSYTGWAVGGFLDYGNYNHHIVLTKTTNGGINWIKTVDSNSYAGKLISVYFINSLTGWVVASGTSGFCATGALMKSTNGGISFATSLDNPFTNGGVRFLDASTGYVWAYPWTDVPAYDSGYVYKTTNTGSSWTKIFTKSHASIRSVHFPTFNNGYIIDDAGKLYYTVNGGSNWMTVITGLQFFSNIFFNNINTGWLVGNNIYKTTDNGIDWVKQTDSIFGINGLSVLDNNNAWVCNGSGKIWRTFTGSIADTDYASYFPLKSGNTYLYHYYYMGPYPSGDFRAKITKDTVMNGHKYYYLYNFPNITGWARYDSSRGNLVGYWANAICSGYTNERIIDSLRSKINDYRNSCLYANIYSHCVDTSNQNIFNIIPSKTKLFDHDALVPNHVRYAKNFGLVYFDSGEPPPINYFVELKGCVINGIMFGDTLLTGLQPLNTKVPEHFQLYQNFPNPFNPITKIKFDVSLSGRVLLKVIDILGKEVNLLVNEKLIPGTYEVSFDGNNLPSGIYFYSLKYGNSTETKKMILLK